MNLKNKKGITVSSLVLYVVLFFGITTFVSIVYTNMNDTLFESRGTALNYTMLNKLEYNITDSSFKSIDVAIVDDVITFSNGDRYYYDEAKDIVMLNNGILCTSVSKFEPVITAANGYKKLEIQVAFNKYLTTLEKKIISSVEEE